MSIFNSQEEDNLVGKVNSHELSGNDYFSCIQCGKCVGTCPASKVSKNFNIRDINRRIKENDASLIADPAIWECFYCQSCVNICPRDNLDGYKTIIILRDLALKAGHGIWHMKRVIPVIEGFFEKGVLTDGDSWMDADALAEVKIINEKSGFIARCDELKKKMQECNES
ncbi:MAG: 4Fe-4S dicluster domain-containing protein [Promethearchaeota archaeon]